MESVTLTGSGCHAMLCVVLSCVGCRADLTRRRRDVLVKWPGAIDGDGSDV